MRADSGFCDSDFRFILPENKTGIYDSSDSDSSFDEPKKYNRLYTENDIFVIIARSIRDRICALSILCSVKVFLVGAASSLCVFLRAHVGVRARWYAYVRVCLCRHVSHRKGLYFLDLVYLLVSPQTAPHAAHQRTDSPTRRSPKNRQPHMPSTKELMSLPYHTVDVFSVFNASPS